MRNISVGEKKKDKVAHVNLNLVPLWCRGFLLQDALFWSRLNIPFHELIDTLLHATANIKWALLFNLIMVQPPRALLPFASFLNSQSHKDEIMQFSLLFVHLSDVGPLSYLNHSWLRSVLPYSCTIIKRSMLMINYAYRHVCRWTNAAHKEATYCTELMADWIRSSCIAICLQCFKQRCNPKSHGFPHDQQTALTSHKVNLHFWGHGTSVSGKANVQRLFPSHGLPDWQNQMVAAMIMTMMTVCHRSGKRELIVPTNEKAHTQLRVIIIMVPWVDNQCLG